MSNRVKPVKAKKLSWKELAGYSKNFLKFTITMSPPVFCFLRAVDRSPRSGPPYFPPPPGDNKSWNWIKSKCLNITTCLVVVLDAAKMLIKHINTQYANK